MSLTTHRILSLFLVILFVSISPAWALNSSDLNHDLKNPFPSLSNQNESDSMGFESRVRVEDESYYDIRIISPEFLTLLISRVQEGDQILKIGPGMVIGLYTPRVLYIRGDLSSDDYLTSTRQKKSMKDEITKNLIDLSFGVSNSNLSILNSDLPYLFWFDKAYTTDDVETALNFAKEFNNLSQTARFEDDTVMLGELKNNYQQIPYNYYNIQIVPMKFLNEYKEDKYDSVKEDLLKDEKGTMIGFLSPHYLLLWDGLSQSDRNSYLTRSLFWSVGVRGKATLDDSRFFSTTPSSSPLSELDKEVIKLLYGGRLNNSMKPDDVRKALDTSAKES